MIALLAVACSGREDARPSPAAARANNAPDAATVPDPEEPGEEPQGDGGLPPRETSCTDGIDNDGNGLIDCADPVCRTGNVGCIENAVNCSNGIDEDGDGLVDCADPDCAARSDSTLSGPLPLVINGDTRGMGNDYALVTGNCGEGIPNRSEDIAYTFVAPATGTYRFTAGVTADVANGIAVIIARPVCGTPEIACKAYDVPGPADVALTSGESVLVIVDPVFNDERVNVASEGGGGPFVLRIEQLP